MTFNELDSYLREVWTMYHHYAQARGARHRTDLIESRKNQILAEHDRAIDAAERELDDSLRRRLICDAHDTCTAQLRGLNAAIARSGS
jgi:hypothetical protein